MALYTVRLSALIVARSTSDDVAARLGSVEFARTPVVDSRSVRIERLIADRRHARPGVTIGAEARGVTTLTHHRVSLLLDHVAADPVPSVNHLPVIAIWHLELDTSRDGPSVAIGTKLLIVAGATGVRPTPSDVLVSVEVVALVLEARNRLERVLSQVRVAAIALAIVIVLLVLMASRANRHLGRQPVELAWLGEVLVAPSAIVPDVLVLQVFLVIEREVPLSGREGSRIVRYLVAELTILVRLFLLVAFVTLLLLGEIHRGQVDRVVDGFVAGHAFNLGLDMPAMGCARPVHRGSEAEQSGASDQEQRQDVRESAQK